MSNPISRPILFSAPMVRAILDGRKTQTRRIVKPRAFFSSYERMNGLGRPGESINKGRCPYGQPGDRLWVKESYRLLRQWDRTKPSETATFQDRSFEADGQRPEWAGKLRPSIHMPRWASRITLEITGVRVERLQEISRGDAMSEGCPHTNMQAGPNPCNWYATLWEQINRPGSWAANPWVWVVEFKRVTP